MANIGIVSKTWAGEPAVIKSTIAAILVIVAQLLNGTTDVNSAIPDIVSVLIPFITGFWIRQSVTPTAKATDGANNDGAAGFA